MWFLAGFLLVRYFRGVCLTVLVIASLAFVGYSPLGWLPFLAVMTGWWWPRRSRLRRIARQQQAIADEQYRLMQLQAELNAQALHELLSRETGGYQRWQSQACRTSLGRTDADTVIAYLGMTRQQLLRCPAAGRITHAHVEVEHRSWTSTWNAPQESTPNALTLSAGLPYGFHTLQRLSRPQQDSPGLTIWVSPGSPQAAVRCRPLPGHIRDVTARPSGHAAS